MNDFDSFVADLQAPERLEPSKRSLNDPAMLSQMLLRLNSTTCNAVNDASIAQGLPAAEIVIPLIGVQFPGFSARTTARPLDGCDRIQNRNHHPGIVNIRRRECDRNGNAPSIDRDMVLCPISSAIRGVRAQRFAPFLAGTLDPSTDTRRMSMLSSLPRVLSRSFHTRSQTPRLCHSISRRRQVLPDPQFNSLGSAFQGMANRRTTRMPIIARRSSKRGRPPFRDFFGRGNWGWMRSQSLLGSRFDVIHMSYLNPQQLTAS